MSLRSWNPKQRLPITFFLILCTIIASIHATQSNLKPPAASPEASISLICPTEKASDCYPSEFQPSIHFQPIRPNQSLPPGLHVRINIATGEKEARFNIPENKQEREKGIVVIDDVPRSKVSSETEGALSTVEEHAVQMHLKDPVEMSDRNRLPKGRKPPKSFGPSNDIDSSEMGIYDAAKVTLCSVPNDRDVKDKLEALATLTDLSHSLDWGITITRDADLCAHLVQLLNRDWEHSSIEDEFTSAVLLLLGTAIQNNIPANNELQDYLESHRLDLIEYAAHRLERQFEKLSTCNDYNEQASIATHMTRAVFFLTQFCMGEYNLVHFTHDFGLLSPTKNYDGPLTGVILLRMIFSFPFTTPHSHAKIPSPAASDPLIKLSVRIANFIGDYALRIAPLTAYGYPSPLYDGSTFLNEWCEPLSRAMSTRSSPYDVKLLEHDDYDNGEKVVTTADDDAAHQSFVAARDSIAQALKEHSTSPVEVNAACGWGFFLPEERMARHTLKELSDQTEYLHH